MKAYVWENGAMEATVKEIPENMMAEAQEWREEIGRSCCCAGRSFDGTFL